MVNNRSEEIPGNLKIPNPDARFRLRIYRQLAEVIRRNPKGITVKDLDKYCNLKKLSIKERYRYLDNLTKYGNFALWRRKGKKRLMNRYVERDVFLSHLHESSWINNSERLLKVIYSQVERTTAMWIENAYYNILSSDSFYSTVTSQTIQAMIQHHSITQLSKRSV